MAENTFKAEPVNQNKPAREKKEKKEKKDKNKKFFGFLSDPRLALVFGFFLLVLSIYFLSAFVSYLFTGKEDQSLFNPSAATLIESGYEASNWLGYYGAFLSHYFIFRWLGMAAFAIPPLLFLIGFQLVFKKALYNFFHAFTFLFFSGLWITLLFGYLTRSIGGVTEISFLSGGLGYRLASFFDSLFGWGTFLVLILSLLVFIIYYFNITSIALPEKKVTDATDKESLPDELAITPLAEKEEEKLESRMVEPEPEAAPVAVVPPVDMPADIPLTIEEPLDLPTPEEDVTKTAEEKTEPVFEIAETKKEPEEVAEQLVEAQGLYDPTLDLSSFQLPPLEMLNEIEAGKIQVTPEELNANKDRIVETLKNFKIGITGIKATIGPTVTLYEIVPEAGIKISRIKNLEDDIALSLAALGIRIIAPIPGKGTIGIEVPNKNRQMVGIRTMLGSEKFQKSDRELPIALGKTISNDELIIDLAKMPHMLVAGATGQGKSVGLNVILTSLLYKRHPSQLKFVLVDPKKVEMSLYSKLERHYLAKLPNSEEAIITDTKKVVHTLNSLCIEMENRYELLKEAGTRNLKEYNTKFVERKLNPKDGHRFMPYIVLIIDELADLMMTAGKEVETPIARLAQLARAIGIHLVVATQRPSVNVITGVIKANFPARLSFRVTSKVDSRTILDAGGAEQLIGHGDMLLSTGSDIIRVQCPFVDTPEIDRVCDFIGAQRGYESAYMLPEFEDEEGGAEAVDLSDRDEKFEEAARLIVAHQQGSTSLIQRKMKLGYNRAGRLIDQLEAAGIVGAFEGSKAREVLIKDEMSLEQLLSTLNKPKEN